MNKNKERTKPCPARQKNEKRRTSEKKAKVQIVKLIPFIIKALYPTRTDRVPLGQKGALTTTRNIKAAASMTTKRGTV